MDALYRVVNAVGRAALSALGVDVRVHGVERIPATGPVVLAANHDSFLDFVIVEYAAVKQGRFVRFLARHDAWVPAVAWAMDGMHHVPVDRTVPAAAYLAGRRLLREGEALGVFPEAGLSHGFTVRPLMKGAVALAAETGAPVVPVVSWGAQRITTVGDGPAMLDLRRGRVVDVSVGEPFRVPEGADLVAWTQHLGVVLTGMLEELQRLPHHRPRPGEHAAWYPAHLGGHAPDVVRSAALDDVPFSAVPPVWGPTSRAGRG